MILFLFTLPTSENLLTGVSEVIVALIFYFFVLVIIRGVRIEDFEFLKSLFRS